MLKSREVTYKIQQLLRQTVFHLDEHQAIITYLYAFYEDGHEPDTSFFLTYLPDPNLRRIVSEIEMMSVNEEVTDKELTDCINQVLKYEKLLKIKEKQEEQKEAVRRSDYGSCCTNCNGNYSITKNVIVCNCCKFWKEGN